MEELKQDEIVGKEKQSNYVFLIPLLMDLGRWYLVGDDVYSYRRKFSAGY